MYSKSALVVVTDGSEDMEAVVTVDMLRRAGIKVVVASLSSSKVVKCCQGTTIKTDATLDELKYVLHDAIVIVGGFESNGIVPGSIEMCTSLDIKLALNTHHQVGNIVAATGTGAEVFAAHSLGRGKRITCHPLIKPKMNDYTVSDKPVVREGHMLTCKGPGPISQFALSLVEMIEGRGKSERVRKEMFIPSD